MPHILPQKLFFENPPKIIPLKNWGNCKVPNRPKIEIYRLSIQNEHPKESFEIKKTEKKSTLKSSRKASKVIYNPHSETKTLQATIIML